MRIWSVFQSKNINLCDKVEFFPAHLHELSVSSIVFQQLVFRASSLMQVV